MDFENCAHGAQTKSYVSRPTGFRRLTPGLLATDQHAEKFTGMPKDVTAPGQLLAAFKAAAPMLGLSSRLVHAIDWLFQFTNPQDWEEGTRPIVWPSASLQQQALDLSITQTKAINRQLIETGLMTMKDSPTGKRYGHRSAKGKIIEAYGFDLSPIAVRYAEFLTLAEEGRAQREALAKLRRRATIARRGITQILDTVHEYGLADDCWQELAVAAQTIVGALRLASSTADVEVGVESLERRQRAAKDMLEASLGVVDTAPSQPENRPHITATNEPPNPMDTVTAQRACSRTAGPIAGNAGAGERFDDFQHADGKIRPEELIRLAPRLKPYLRHASPDWRDIVDAADWLRADLDISKSLWGDACLTLGRERAAVALAIVSTKPKEHFRSGPGGYYHAMIRRAKTGELNLDRTIWGLRRALQPDNPQTAKV